MNLAGGGQTLTEAELDRLADFLKNSGGERALNLEAVDGLFTALIAGPEVVPPSEYLPVVFGGPMGETCEFASMGEANEILGLIMRHWNAIASALAKGTGCEPLREVGGSGPSPCNDWARGFVRGIETRATAWKPIFEGEEFRWLIGVMMLAHEHDEDPEMRPEPIGAERREEVIRLMAAGVAKVYEYFRKQPGIRKPSVPVSARAVKVGRNELCPCRSGKKYKRCCGAATLH